MQLVLIRHARPLRVELEHGPADPELSEVGHAQARAVARWLAGEHIDTMYVSPMRRALQTAEPIAAITGLEAIVDEGIAEWDRDSSEYIPIEELKAEGDDRWRELPEGLDEFGAKVVRSIEAIVAKHPGERVALVCHGGVINVYTGWVLGGPERPMFFLPHYTSISRVWAASSGERSIESLNEIAHLRDLID